MEQPTRESLLMLKKGIKRRKIIKMFGEPDKSERMGDSYKKLYGENLERMINYTENDRKKLLSVERLAYLVPGGQICLNFIYEKLDSWKYFPS